MISQTDDIPDAAALVAARIVPGRACGTCTMCCKLIAVAAFDKQPGTWCPHCVRGKGCGIYDTRPVECRTFYCHWMLEQGLGAEWKPERAKFALVVGAGGHMTAFVDPGFPSAWRGAPYFETLRRWALEGARANPPRVVSVRVGARVLVVLPDREVDVGAVGPNNSIEVQPGPGGRLDVRKVTRTE